MRMTGIIAITAVAAAVAGHVGAEALQERARLQTCLLATASDGEASGRYSAEDPRSLSRMVQKCPNSFTSFMDACIRSGATDDDCRLEVVIMAIGAAERFKR